MCTALCTLKGYQTWMQREPESYTASGSFLRFWAQGFFARAKCDDESYFRYGEETQ